MESCEVRTRVRVALLHDHALFREALLRRFQSEPDLEVVCACGAGRDALAALESSGVDIVMIDSRAAFERSAHFITAAREAGYTGNVLLLAEIAEPAESLKAFGWGASGVVFSDSSPETVVSALRLVASGSVYLDQRVIRWIVDPDLTEETLTVDAAVTEREKHVVRGVCRGFSNRRIAQRLGVSEAVVKSTLRHLFRKTGVSSRSQLVRAALERRAVTAAGRPPAANPLSLPA